MDSTVRLSVFERSKDRDGDVERLLVADFDRDWLRESNLLSVNEALELLTDIEIVDVFECVLVLV